MKNLKIFLILFCFSGLFSSNILGQIIMYPASGSHMERFAAKEVRRYLYLRTGKLLTLKAVNKIPDTGEIIVVANDSDPLVKTVTRLQAPLGGFFIKTVTYNGRDILVISGADDSSTLYGAYRFAEKLGCRFYFHGDVIPDEKIPLDITGFDEHGQPITKDGRQWTTRGVQPFQNFPAGVVMWGRDD
jgi:hypothetical protein